MNIILLGAPGSGKGTQAEYLVERQKFIQLSTGDLMRKAMSDKTSLGIECEKYISNGQLVPDYITNGIVNEYMQKVNDNLIFDGYPRTVNQAEFLDEMLNKLNKKINLVIFIDVEESILVERISGRIVCPTCKRSYHKINKMPKIKWICDFDATPLIVRSDDSPEKTKTRLEVYSKQTKTLISYYEKRNILRQIHAGNRSADDIYSEIEKEMELIK
ncbi:adenylate kinase [Spiroplasma endosymbiont of Labia minor]|uniref:adenylate kinase n=1 Tax=Spiroplasma endosymbiont of Labia minor TaxID=3066305 RepID=UPI0030D4B1B9